MMNPHATPHMVHSHPGGGYPPPMYGAGPSGPPPPSAGGPPPMHQGMPQAPASHHMHHAGPPPGQGHGHHPSHHLSRGGPPPSQANGLPPPPGGPSPRVMHGSALPHPESQMMAPPPPRSASAAGQHAAMHPHGPSPYDVGGPGQPVSIVQKLAQSNEQAWISIGLAAESMEDYERAIAAYESALRHNPYSVPAMNAIAGVHRTLDRFEKAVDYFQRVLNIVPENGETWGAMGHCYLMMDDLQKAYTAYQQALYHLPNPKEPKLWYGIGILYDRYGSLEHAEEAFASVVHMDPGYEKANEIYFRLGIIYKQQSKYQASLECFRYILSNPPRPLTQVDIWFQIGHVHEQQKEFTLAKEAYERVLAENPSHAKVLQQLGWLYHQSDAGFEDQEQAILFLTKSLESDPNDAQSWYLLGRAYMAGRNYNKAYEAYQQAVYRDGKNPTFWCSIGVLYYQISQYRDALDAYSRAIRLNPYISEVWFDLGSLYESCNNQVSDAIDAYVRAAELDPDNPHIQQRLTLLRNAEARGEQVSSVPMPQDVHPTAYANHPGASGGPHGPGGLGGIYGAAPPLNAEGDSPRNLPGPPPHHRSNGADRSPSGREGFDHAAAIPNIDDRGTAKGPAHTQLAPMDTPRGMVSPPRQDFAGAHHGRTSPRAQAYSQRGPHSEHEQREREIEQRMMDNEREGRGYTDEPGSGIRQRSFERGGPLPPPRFEPYNRQAEMSEHGSGTSLRGNLGSLTSRGARKDGETAKRAVKSKNGSRATSPGPVSRAPISPKSDSSSGSNRPLAAGNVHQSDVSAASKSRTIDEDYDEGAADALMGLAGAASASAQLTPREENKAEPSASNAAASANVAAPPNDSSSTKNGHVYPSSIGVDESKSEEDRLKEVKERAESAARAEDEAERHRAQQQDESEAAVAGSRKREASTDAPQGSDAAKRQRNDDSEAMVLDTTANEKQDEPAENEKSQQETAKDADDVAIAQSEITDAPAEAITTPKGDAVQETKEQTDAAAATAAVEEGEGSGADQRTEVNGSTAATLSSAGSIANAETTDEIAPAAETGGADLPLENGAKEDTAGVGVADPTEGATAGTTTAPPSAVANDANASDSKVEPVAKNNPAIDAAASEAPATESHSRAASEPEEGEVA